MLPRVRKFLKAVLPQKIVDVLYVALRDTSIAYYRLTHPPLVLRSGKTDRMVFYEVLLLGEYDFPYPEDVSSIIDVGANVGYTSVYFSQKFPKAKIIAVEPDRANFAVLEQNIARLPNVRAINGGVWSKPGRLKMVDVQCGESGLTTAESEAGALDGTEAITMEELVAMAGGDVDVVKMDVEGAEREIFSVDCDRWLSKVKMLVIEVHDFRWAGCRAAVEGALTRLPHTTTMKGNVLAITFSNKS